MKDWSIIVFIIFFLLLLVLENVVSFIVGIVVGCFLLFNTFWMEDLVEESVDLLDVGLPPFGLHASGPTLKVFVAVQTSPFDAVVICPELEQGVVQVKENCTSFMIGITMVPHSHTVLTGHLLAKETFPSLRLILVAHGTLYWRLFHEIVGICRQLFDLE